MKRSHDSDEGSNPDKGDICPVVLKSTEPSLTLVTRQITPLRRRRIVQAESIGYRQFQNI